MAARVSGHAQKDVEDVEDVAGSLVNEGLVALSAIHGGSAAPFIVSQAEREPSTLIAMCTHGRTGVTRFGLGNVTGKVLHASTSPS